MKIEANSPDDYISKPFEVEELILRINNIIKRTKQQQTINIEEEVFETLQIGKYLLDVKNLSLTIENHTFKITEKEAQLIVYLYKNKNSLIPLYILT